MELVQAIRRCLASHVRPGEDILVGVSGGPDSCALLHALAGLREAHRVGLRALHVHHGIRGEEADADAAFVTDLCAHLNVPCLVRQCDALGAARRLHVSKQEAARALRMELLWEAAEATGSRWIALGHTLDDHVETVLMNILRGTGLEGLAGIAEVEAPFIRPLRSVRRRDTIAYCREHGINYRVDTSNASFAYLRNRVRSELLPMLEAYYNPAVVTNLDRLSRLAGEESAYLNTLAREALEAAAGRCEPAEVCVPARALTSAPAALRRRMIREAIRSVRGNLHGVEWRHIEQVVQALERPDRRRPWALTLPEASVAVRLCGQMLQVERVDAPAEAARRRWSVTVPGVTEIPELGITLLARYAAGGELPESSGGNTAFVNADVLAPPLTVRTRRPGDRIRPLGLGGTKKVQDVLVDAKIPRRVRDRIPIIEDDLGILWIVGCTLDERARVTPHTRRVLVLEVQGPLREDMGAR